MSLYICLCLSMSLYLPLLFLGPYISLSLYLCPYISLSLSLSAPSISLPMRLFEVCLTRLHLSLVLTSVMSFFVPILLMRCKAPINQPPCVCLCVRARASQPDIHTTEIFIHKYMFTYIYMSRFSYMLMLQKIIYQLGHLGLTRHILGNWDTLGYNMGGLSNKVTYKCFVLTSVMSSFVPFKLIRNIASRGSFHKAILAILSS